MPPFAERESSILAKLKKKAPDGAAAQTGIYIYIYLSLSQSLSQYLSINICIYLFKKL